MRERTRECERASRQGGVNVDRHEERPMTSSCFHRLVYRSTVPPRRSVTFPSMPWLASFSSFLTFSVSHIYWLRIDTCTSCARPFGAWLKMRAFAGSLGSLRPKVWRHAECGGSDPGASADLQESCDSIRTSLRRNVGEDCAFLPSLHTVCTKHPTAAPTFRCYCVWVLGRIRAR